MPENPAKSPAQEWWTKSVEPIVDIWHYFRDRYTILATSGTATMSLGAVKVSFFKFAILSVVVPALLVDGAFGILQRRLIAAYCLTKRSKISLTSWLCHSAPSPTNNEKGGDDQTSRDQLQAEFDRLLKERNAGKSRSQLTPNEQADYDNAKIG